MTIHVRFGVLLPRENRHFNFPLSSQERGPGGELKIRYIRVFFFAFSDFFGGPLFEKVKNPPGWFEEKHGSPPFDFNKDRNGIFRLILMMFDD
jgi:hypothetical protein